MYQCAEVVDNVCQSWVQVSFLGLPDITLAEAQALVSIFIGFFAFCWIGKQLLNSAKS